MSSDGVYPALVHDYDLIRIHNRCYALGNNYGRCLIQLLSEGAAYLGVRRCIYRAGAIIQNYNFWVLKEGPCNAKPLFLSSGHVYAALSKLGFIFVRHVLYEFFGLSGPACLPYRLIRSRLIAPKKVILYRSGEQLIFLQNHGNRFSQAFNAIFTYVVTANDYAARICVVQPWYQLHQRRFRRSRASDDAHRFASLDFKVYVNQGAGVPVA